MALGGNRFGKTALQYVRAIESAQEAIVEEHRKFVKRTAKHREEIKDIYDAAKGHDIKRKILANALKHRKLKRDLAAIGNDMPEDDAHDLDLFLFATGDIDNVEDRPAPEGLPDSADGEDRDSTLAAG